MLVNENVRDKVFNFSVEDRVESDHAPIKLVLEGIFEDRRESLNKESIGTSRKKTVLSWNEEAIEVFKAKTESMDILENEEDSGEKVV